MNGPRLRLELRVDDAPLERGWAGIEHFLNAHACSERVHFVAGLVFEEAVSNLFERAAEPPDSCRIELELRADVAALVMTISDAGAPFDPCQAAPPPRPASLDTAPVGGRGVHLMRSMARSMRYARRGERNWLEVCIGDEPPGERRRPESAGQG